MSTLRFILGDQLTRTIPTLDGLDPAEDTVLLVEVMEEATYVPHHKQKIVLVLAAMRHFAQDLRAEGIRVDYVRLDDPENTGSFTGELERAARRHLPDAVVVTEPGEWRVLGAMEGWRTTLNVPIEIRPDTRFYCSRKDFAAWAGTRTHYRMEAFYRTLRARTGLLMEGGEPAGGRWNFDAENRKPWPADRAPPQRLRFSPDAVTRAVIDLVAARFPAHFGDLDDFGWGVTRADARAALEDFAVHCLPSFGDYQDAMRAGAPFLYHATLSPYLNAGLLTAREVVDRAMAAYEAGTVPLNAIEGFVRQILGWREFVRGVYWRRMPGYADTNALNATRALPAFYWTGETAMNCLRQAIADTKRHAYAHHINRLMITGNFALLAGIRPAEIEEWYLVVYADAYEWVELPNVHGMALFADGGLMASKPYAAGGAYIDRMSDYCRGCAYSPKVKQGPRACPFNDLYWAFLIRNGPTLARNPRLAMPYRTLAAWDRDRKEAIVARADRFLDSLPTGYPAAMAPPAP
ncbi:(6-4) photolyase [Methylobacterium adhaesivum]|uniref:Cryptochrome/photolyase family protein n=1 Tax=Methylobacterium adhaesivum TaxID=333297 RepID=A0ABT8BEX0_9HYPH|nr:cryptochrome/photolyase family protein [Methylobacterium adhaesivum]MDN3589763.1 cryptochrome/photolyase family protein [Methylobacterium adhaesivum]GJD28821.1 (6-4) photolyase [Methylobacterium adhaesivum]